MAKREPKRASEREIEDKEAEGAVIGSVLLDPDCMANLDLSPEDFFYYDLRVIFNTCLDMWQRGEPIDEKSVHDHLPGDVSAAILPAAIAQTPTSAHAEYYARRVRDCSVRRKLRDLAGDIDKMASDNESSLAGIYDLVSARMESFNWPPLMTRFVIFRNGRELRSSPPLYSFDVIRPRDGFTQPIRLTSTMLSQRSAFIREVRERMSVEPMLPKDNWGDFINYLVYSASKEPAPATASHDQEVLYWFREWFRRGHEAETVDDLQTGYAVRDLGAAQKDEWFFFQINRVLHWLKDRIKTTQQELWAIVEPMGARRDWSVRLKDESRKLWGVKDWVVFPQEKEEGEQMELEETEGKDVDISFLTEWEEKEVTDE